MHGCPGIGFRGAFIFRKTWNSIRIDDVVSSADEGTITSGSSTCSGFGRRDVRICTNRLSCGGPIQQPRDAASHRAHR